MPSMCGTSYFDSDKHTSSKLKTIIFTDNYNDIKHDNCLSIFAF